jgi:hypothetical protein
LRSRLARASPEQATYQNDLARTQRNLGLLLDDMRMSAEALQELTQARELLSGLVKTYPDRTRYAIELSHTCLNRGQLVWRTTRDRQCLPDLDRGISLLDRLAQNPGSRDSQIYLVAGLVSRALAYTHLRQPALADADWDRALALATTAAHRFRLQMARIQERAKAGDYLRSGAETEKLDRAESLNGDILYEFACIQALASASAARDPKRPLAERGRRAELYARQAVAFLHRATAAGLFRSKPRLINHMDQDTDLDCLRDRDDFKKLCFDLKQHQGSSPPRK